LKPSPKIQTKRSRSRETHTLQEIEKEHALQKETDEHKQISKV